MDLVHDTKKKIVLSSVFRIEIHVYVLPLNSNNSTNWP